MKDYNISCKENNVGEIMKFIYVIYFVALVLFVRLVFLTSNSYKKRIQYGSVVMIIIVFSTYIYVNISMTMSQVFELNDQSYLSIYIDSDHVYNSSDINDEMEHELYSLINNLKLNPTLNIISSGDDKLFGNQMSVGLIGDSDTLLFVVSDSGYIKINDKGVYKLEEPNLYNHIVKMLKDM